MSANVRALVPAVMPPMRLENRRRRRSARPPFLPQIARVSYALAALALPSLGLALTHGVPGPDTRWAKDSIVTAIALADTSSALEKQRVVYSSQTPRFLMSSIRTK